MEKSAAEILELFQKQFSPVVEFDSAKDRLLKLDFTPKNNDINADILTDINSFINYINSRLQSAGARYGIGGYNENRTIYSSSKVFDDNEPGGEPRRLHLGIDIWGKPYTKVMAPLGGIIHSFAFNNHFGDYGATLILSHYIDGFTFYTLYGHLSLNSIKNIQEGDRVRKGDVIAEFGIPVENGHWPPHLHFQLIIDIGDNKGDYPGVCKFSEREKYLNNCPDPDLVVQMMQFA
ncbi:MAG: peptidoglycan DD-metalloendopeptidase family protein [Bacteroidetes bacterium]|nr:peptidoglycan DD-metalloendopeptidase family protein [Bacteroidota bacterium]